MWEAPYTHKLTHTLKLVLESKLKCGPRPLDSHSTPRPTIICCFCLAAKLCSTLWDLMDCSPPGCLCPWDCLGKNTGVGSHFYPRGSSQLRDWTRGSCLAGGFFTIWATWEAPFLPSRSKSASLIFHISVNGNSILLVLWAQTSQLSLTPLCLSHPTSNPLGNPTRF